MSNQVNDAIFDRLADEYSDLLSVKEIPETFKKQIYTYLAQGDLESAEEAFAGVAKFVRRAR